MDLACAGQLQHTFPPFPTLFFVFSRVARFRTRHFAVINTIPPRSRALCYNGGAYLPFCPRRRASHHVHFAQPVLICMYCTHVQTHIRKSIAHDSNPCSAIYDTPCIDCRPAQPATLSVGTRQLLRALSLSASRSAHQSFVPDSLRPAGSGDQSQSQIAAAHKQQAFTAISSCSTARRRGGAWRVQLLSSNRHSNVN